MPRMTLDDADKPGYRGGALSQPAPKRLRYPCFATGCPMPGTIWPGIVQGGTGDKPGTCAWHYGVASEDIPRVTSVILQWQCISDEINRARTFANRGEGNPQDALADAWQRMEPQISQGWHDELRPGTIRTAKGVNTGFRQSYGDWYRHLEQFLAARLAEVTSPGRRKSA